MLNRDATQNQLTALIGRIILNSLISSLFSVASRIIISLIEALVVEAVSFGVSVESKVGYTGK